MRHRRLLDLGIGDRLNHKKCAAFGDVFLTVTAPVTAEATLLRVTFAKNLQTPATHEFGATQSDRFNREKL